MDIDSIKTFLLILWHKKLILDKKKFFSRVIRLIANFSLIMFRNLNEAVGMRVKITTEIQKTLNNCNNRIFRS